MGERGSGSREWDRLRKEERAKDRWIENVCVSVCLSKHNNPKVKLVEIGT